MQPEIEVKFIQIDHDQMRRSLSDAGATLVTPMRLMRRVIFGWPKQPERNLDSYVRVRDEGDKIVLTYKKFNHLGVDGAQEIETTVSDYDATISLLQEIGLKPKSRQESRRETWGLQGVEIVLDEWPWVSPFMEIEGASTQALQKAASLLGLEWSEAVSGAVTQVYKTEYAMPKEMDISHAPEIRFDLPVPQWLARLRIKET